VSAESGKKILISAFTLGVVAGMRSQMPLALLAWRIRKDRAGGEPVGLPAVVERTWFAPLATMLAVGELIGDKLPMTPSRLSPGPLVGRIVFGGCAGAVAATLSRQTPAWGALAGACGALVGSFGGYHARRSIVSACGLPDPLVAVAEDSIAIGIGTWAVSSVPQKDIGE
jgi:uncharacterized membrane protein